MFSALTSMLWVTSFGSRAYYVALEALAQSALSNGGADGVVLWTEHDDDLPGSMSFGNFKRHHPELFNSNTKGGGYYSLKPYIVARTLHMMKEHDVLIFCDSTCVFRRPVDLRRYTAPVNLFRLHGGTYPNRQWTKPELFRRMNAPEHVCDEQQLNAAVQVYRKDGNGDGELFALQYRDWCCLPEVMSESQDPGIQHRHDQSVLSILASHYPDRVRLFDDITQFGPAAVDAPILHHRSLLDGERTFRLDIITPTINRNEEHLMKCVRSVQQQRLPGAFIGRLHHWIVLDGPLEDEEGLRQRLRNIAGRVPTRVVTLPVNTGAGGWNGHRIYAAMSHLVDGSWVMWLDEDNWLEPDHVSSLWTTLGDSKYPVDTLFCLRNIVDHSGEFVCQDLCESLGAARASVLDPSDFFSDTGCMAVRRPLAAGLSGLWNVRAREPGRPEADRALSAALYQRVCATKCEGVPSWAPTRKATLNYRLGGSDVSVKADFFLGGNRRVDWQPARRDLYVFHFGPDQTRELLLEHARSSARPATLADSLREWQPTLFNSVRSFNLLNGYDHMRVGIPPGSLVYASLCFPQMLPLNEVFSRTDLSRLVYTVESPNLAHHQQWRLEFLRTYFDVWMTYWQPLLREPQSVRCLANTHHLQPDDSGSLAHHLLTNTSDHNSVCIVLSNRPGCKAYNIDQHMLTQLDHMREHIVKDLKIACYGKGWERLTAQRPNVSSGGSAGKFDDHESSVQIMQRYAFTIIVENCDAENYVSEKIYDAFVAGSIPCFFGNMGAVNIPTDMYIDVRKCASSSEELQRVILNHDVERTRRAIYRQREQVLKEVCTEAFERALNEAVEMTNAPRPVSS